MGPLRSDDSQDDQAGEAGPFYQRPSVSKLTQRGLSGSSPDQKVLVTVRREAGPCEQKPTQGLHSEDTQ